MEAPVQMTSEPLSKERHMEALRRQYGPDYEQPTAVPMLTDLMARFPFTPVALTGIFPFAAK